MIKLFMRMLLVLLIFNVFGIQCNANESNSSLAAFSSGALLVKKFKGYDATWDNIWIMDEDPKTGWCSKKGQIINNICVIELAEKSVINHVEFDTGSIDGAGRGAKDIVIELSNDGPVEEFKIILEVSLSDKKDQQSFPVSVDLPGKWLRLTIKNNHGSKDYTELMDFRAYGEQLTKTQLPDISGTYKTNFNDFHIRQQGTSVTGCYEYNQGLLNGGLESNILTLNWKEQKKQGPAVIVLNSTGSQFFGFWWYAGKENKRGNFWNGQKISDEIGGCPHWEGNVQDEIR